MFGFSNLVNMFSNAKDAGGSEYADSELLGAYKQLSYQECQDIYRYWPLGKRIAQALPNFALSVPRIFLFNDAPPEVADRFKGVNDAYNIDKLVRKASIYARIYGLSAIYCASDDNGEAPLTRKDILAKSFTFNCLDPLSLGGSISVDIDPLSPTYQQVMSTIVRGRKVNPKRICYIYNDIPLYLKWSVSSYSWGGVSIYQNMTLLIRSWNRALIAMQRISTKAGSIIKKSKDFAHASGFNFEAIRKNLELMRRMENDGIANISVGEEIELFQLSGLQEVDAIISQLNSSLMMALSDTPTGILLDKNLSSGMADGSEDMKAIIMAVEQFRELMLKPLYNFVDYFLLYKAFDKEFLQDLKSKYPDLYRNVGEEELLTQLVNGYQFQFGELYPSTEKEQSELNTIKLDTLTKIKELGGSIVDIESALNSLNLFGQDFALEEPQEPNMGEEGVNGEEENQDDI